VPTTAIAAFSLPRSSSTVVRSSIHSSSVGSAVAGTGSDKPAALVEVDHARKMRQTVVEPRERSDLALDLDVAEPPLGHDDVLPIFHNRRPA